MTPRPGRRRVALMPDATPTTLHLELSLEAWPEPHGTLRDPHGREEAFHGFLGFAAALEALVGQAPVPTPHPDQEV